MQANIQTDCDPINAVQLLDALSGVFGPSLPLQNALDSSRQFQGTQASQMYSLIYGFRPTTRSLALFFAHPTFVECHVEAGPTGSEPIYTVCEQVVERLVTTLKRHGVRPRRLHLAIEEDNQNDARISAKVPSYWTMLKDKFLTRDIIGKVLAFGAFVAGSIFLTDLRDAGLGIAAVASGIALIALGAASAIEALFEYVQNRGRLIWEVRR